MTEEEFDEEVYKAQLDRELAESFDEDFDSAYKAAYAAYKKCCDELSPIEADVARRMGIDRAWIGSFAGYKASKCMALWQADCERYYETRKAHYDFEAKYGHTVTNSEDEHGATDIGTAGLPDSSP